MIPISTLLEKGMIIQNDETGRKRKIIKIWSVKMRIAPHEESYTRSYLINIAKVRRTYTLIS